MNEMTQILEALNEGQPQSAGQLLPLVYDELRKLATARMRHEPANQTLDATALVHEAYVRLVGAKAGWQNRGHFFAAAAAEAMRRILVESARRKKRVRHGGGQPSEPLVEQPAEALPDAVDILALHEALEKLEAHSPRKAELVKLRYFAGCTLPELATMLGISGTTAKPSATC